ncbi:MAG: M28 family peptidase [Bacteroidales bacterium]|jgi:aminopeptidase YwaD|nr:M28 family peptidase [Bacteroidales bacterium]
METQKQVATEKIKAHLQMLCTTIGERAVGSANNRKATDYVHRTVQNFGWEVEKTELAVMDWTTDGATLACGEQSFEVFASPYSLGGEVVGELLAIDTLQKLEQAEISGKIVLLYGEIAAQQIMPKNFPFWNPEEHQHLVSLLEGGKALSIITATARNAALAGGVYPFPMFEDGDFDLPNVFMKDSEGEKLLACAGHTITLISNVNRIPETAYNLVARKNSSAPERIVLSAHIDTKKGTPGALDNGTGVAALLALAELLQNLLPKYTIELAFFNGEDYYNVPGQMKYMEQNFGKFGNIALNINIDGAGYKEGKTAFSPFNVPENVEAVFQNVLAENPEITEGAPWYQGDHSMFLQQGVPAIAVCSQWFLENMTTQTITHTPQDNLSIVNPERVAEVALAIAELLANV